jgi:ribosomal protein S18 acetylase RimI-like enzyme
MPTIVPAQPNDVAQIVSLVNSAYRGETALQGWTSESHLLEGIRVDEAELTGYFNRSEVTLLKYVGDEGNIDGFVYLERVDGNRLYLGMLTVNPLLQAAGIGRRLLAAANEQARNLNCSFIKITVISTRLELIAWYERRGFVATGETMPLVTQLSQSKVPITLIVMEKMV